MPRKRPRPRKPVDRRRPTVAVAPLVPPGFFDRRALEASMWDAFDEIAGEPGEPTPLRRAQALAYRAFARPDPAERVGLARQALEISADCADAYVLLAEHAPSRREALERFRQGVAAGERALGEEMFREQVGHFWGILETRPYMRAREGLAHALWSACRHEEAVEHLNDMLRLNPSDNQGIRYSLCSWLLNLRRDREVEELLERYGDAAWNWGYTRALLTFRRDGDTAEARKLLEKGHEMNPFIRPWLLNERPFPAVRPAGHSPGTVEEAYFYIEGSRCAWRSVPGAVTWLRRVFSGAAARPAATLSPSRPSASQRARLKRAVKSAETWEAGFRRIPRWMESDGERVIPWVVLVASRSSGRILRSQIVAGEPDVKDLWDTIVAAVESPGAGGPRLPARLETRPHPLWGRLREHLEDLGVDVEGCEDLEILDGLFADLTSKLLENEPPTLLDMPRVKPGLVAGLFRTAADYYRRAPWQRLGDEHAIRVECSRFDSGPWHAIVMGQAGVTLGLALYEDLNQLRVLWRSEPDREREVNGRMTSLAVTFERETIVHPGEVEDAREHGWEVVDPEVFPTFYRKEPGMILRPPLSWELILLEGCLRAIPEFTLRYKPGDGARSEMVVPVATGELKLVLSWVDEGPSDTAG